jgi:transposase
MDGSIRLTREERRTLLEIVRGAPSGAAGAGAVAARPDAERWLAAHPRVRLHFLPTYAPETNPIERVWWHLLETLTRNHRYTSLDQLLDQVMQWLEDRKPHNIETSVYPAAHAA